MDAEWVQQHIVLDGQQPLCCTSLINESPGRVAPASTCPAALRFGTKMGLSKPADKRLQFA